MMPRAVTSRAHGAQHGSSGSRSAAAWTRSALGSKSGSSVIRSMYCMGFLPLGRGFVHLDDERAGPEWTLPRRYSCLLQDVRDDVLGVDGHHVHPGHTWYLRQRGDQLAAQLFALNLDVVGPGRGEPAVDIVRDVDTRNPR